MRKLLYISVFFLLLASCTDDKEVTPLLERAEAYLPEHPDSAGMLLDSISSRPLGDSSKRVRALYGLLRTMTDAMTGKGVTTDSLIRPSYIYYKEQGESDEHTRRLGRSAFYLAQFEASRDSTKRAEDLYREAIRCSEQVEDWRTCYMAYNHFASTITWSNTELAIELRKEAIKIYNRCKDKPANLISILNFLSNDYIFVGFADSAFACANNAYKIACEQQLEDKQYSSLRTLSNLYFETGNYPKALELAKRGMHGLNDRTRDASLFSLADCYLACDSLEQAKNTLLSIHSSDKKTRQVVFEELLQLAHIQNDYESAMCYADSLEAATIDMFTNIQQTKEDYYDALLQQEQESERQHIASLKQQMIFGICLIVAFLVAVLVIAWFVRYKKRQARGKAQLLDKAESLHIELDKLKDEYNLFKTNKDQFEYQLLSQIQDLEYQVSSMSESTNQQRQEEDDSELMDSDVVKYFLAKAQGQYGLGKVKKSELTQLSKAFKTHLPQCYHKLTHHKLSEFELQVAFLTRLNLSTGDIAAMLDTSASNISNTKARANQKLFNQYSGDTLYKNMLSINSAILPKPS
ncbi:MAG: hypothetical protein K6E52_11585 [Bacteroidaceae bacterium]|nr:hypothetical protein [Bacteroidaceae bacterium]